MVNWRYHQIASHDHIVYDPSRQYLNYEKIDLGFDLGFDYFNLYDTRREY